MNATFSRVRLIFAFLLLVTLLCGTWGAIASAQSPISTYSTDGRYTDAEIDALLRAMVYWNTLINSDGKVSSNQGFNGRVDFDKAHSNISFGGAHASGNHISVSRGNGWTDLANRNTQVRNGLYSLEFLVIHELGHTFGIGGGGSLTFAPLFYPNSVRFDTIRSGSWFDHLYRNGVKIRQGDRFHASNYTITFGGGQGNAETVYGDSWVDGTMRQVLVFRGLTGGSSFVHPVTPFGNMNYRYNADTRPFLSEVELAIMKDLGHDINLKNFFGRSFYRTHNTPITVSDTIATLRGTYGIGLHIVSANNNRARPIHRLLPSLPPRLLRVLDEHYASVGNHTIRRESRAHRSAPRASRRLAAQSCPQRSEYQSDVFPPSYLSEYASV